MIDLKKLLDALPAARIRGNPGGAVHDIVSDSRQVKSGDLFVAIRGSRQDGHQFAAEAIRRGAVAVVVENGTMVKEAVAVSVPDTRQALACLAAEFYGRPAERLTLVGITGTNGKTTISRLVKSALEMAGHTVGLIGTIEYLIGEERMPARLTTPDSLELNRLFAEMVSRGVTYAVMEVSSHALSLERVFGLPFTVGVFSNLTRDHLDFHKTEEAYEQAKRRLFEGLDWSRSKAVINRDDPAGRRMMEASRAPVISYGFDRESSIWADCVSLSSQGSGFTVHGPDFDFPLSLGLLGRFNIANALAAVGVGYALDMDLSQVRKGLEQVRTVPGRFEQVECGQPFAAIIDYSHTPDALEKCLLAARELTRGSLIVVFGCGGDRDRGKRPVMGEVAGRLADTVIMTSDNPRSEDPEMILDDIEKGLRGPDGHERIVDRRQAIGRAIELAGHGDCVVIAGKGHEDYQIIGQERLPFSDRVEVERLLKRPAGRG